MSRRLAEVWALLFVNVAIDMAAGKRFPGGAAVRPTL
jgi:hypothetical protein